MTDKQLMKKLEKAQMGVLFKVAFFAPGVAKLPNVLIGDDEARAIFGDPKIGKMADGTEVLRWTAATDGEVIKWYRGFVEAHPVEALTTVECHEVWHCLAGHLWRVPVGVNWEKWNVAADHETNTMLKEFAAGKTPDPFPFPEPQGAYFADPKYTGWAVEAIYADLPDSPQGQGKGPGGKPRPGQSVQGSMPNFGQMIKPGQNGTKASPEKLANGWQNTLLQSAKLMRGNLPGSLERMVEGIVSPKVDWAQLLRSWLREKSNDDWNFDVPAIEYEPSGFLLPSLKSERMGPIVFATDTSGSIGDDLLRKFRAEKQSALDDMRPSKLVDIYADAAVQRVDEYRPGDTIGTKAPGGGGTNFAPVFEHVEKMSEPPKALVYLTDLAGTFPEKEPPYPVLWIVYGNNGAKAPFGETVYAD